MNCSLPYQQSNSNLDVSQCHVYDINSIIYLAIQVLIARDFYTNGRPAVALETIFALVVRYLVDLLKVTEVDPLSTLF